MRFMPQWAVTFIFLIAYTQGKAVTKESNEVKKEVEEKVAVAEEKPKVSEKRESPEIAPVPALGQYDGKLTETSMKKMLSEMNRYRFMHDATPLGYCPVCSEAAQKHADEIASTGIVKPDHKAKYGQIIFSTKDIQDINQGADYFGTLVPARIYNQIKNYDFVKSEFKDNAADFSQLVWEGSEVVGFASRKAADQTVYVVIYFNPAGNNDTMSYYENVNRVTGAGDVDPSGKVKCPDGWMERSSNCYKTFTDPMTWPDAADHCNVLKSSLISAESADDGSYIRSLLMEDTKRAWIGMSDTATSGGFQFVDGTPYVYSDWSPESIQWLYAQKSSSDLKNKCIYATSSGWGYKDCCEKLAFICKMRPNGVLSFALDLYFPGSTFTADLSSPGSTRYNIMKGAVDKMINSSYGAEIWFVGDTFYQFMPRDNNEVADSLLVKFAPDIRAPVDPISKLRDNLRQQNDLKVLAVRLIPGVGRVTTPQVVSGTCPSGCSGDCYPECNPGCCGAAVSLSAPPSPSGFTACPLYPGCGMTCQQSECSQSCCQQNPHQQQSQQQCPQSPGCSPSCAPSCQQSCCQQQQQQQQQQQGLPPQMQQQMQSQMMAVQQAMQIPVQLQALQSSQQQPQQGCSQHPGCSSSCAPKCSQSCCQSQQQQQQPMMMAQPIMLQPVMMQPQMQQQNACSGQFPGCSGACAPACRQSCCSNSVMRSFGGKRSKVSKHTKKSHGKKKLKTQ